MGKGRGSEEGLGEAGQSQAKLEGVLPDRGKSYHRSTEARRSWVSVNQKEEVGMRWAGRGRESGGGEGGGESGEGRRGGLTKEVLPVAQLPPGEMHTCDPST